MLACVLACVPFAVGPMPPSMIESAAVLPRHHLAFLCCGHIVHKIIAYKMYIIFQNLWGLVGCIWFDRKMNLRGLIDKMQQEITGIIKFTGSNGKNFTGWDSTTGNHGKNKIHRMQFNQTGNYRKNPIHGMWFNPTGKNPIHRMWFNSTVNHGKSREKPNSWDVVQFNSKSREIKEKS